MYVCVHIPILYILRKWEFDYKKNKMSTERESGRGNKRASHSLLRKSNNSYTTTVADST
jgi:hypothetical protein